jgi:hypothetical protein
VNHPVVQLELGEFEQGIKVTQAQSWWNYYDLSVGLSCVWPILILLVRVDSRNQRWRFLQVAFMSFFAQLSGNSYVESPSYIFEN